MNDLLKRLKQKKKYLEVNLPIIHHLQDFCKSNDKNITEFELEFKGHLKENNNLKEKVLEIFRRYNLPASMTKSTIQIWDDFHKKVKELDDEYQQITEKIEARSFMKRYGRDIIIAVSSSLITLLVLYILSKFGISL